MITLSRAALLSSAALVLSLSQAHAAATVSVTCSATKKVQTAIDSASAGNPTTINISGNCVENLTIPQGKTIIIKGSLATATITAKDTTQPAVVSRGDTTIQNVLVQNTAPSSGNIADAVVEGEDGGVLRLYGDRLEGGAGADAVVGVYDNATAYVYNSRVSGGASDAIDTANAASVILGANSGTVQGPDGYTSNINNDVFCGPGSSLFIRIKGSGNMAITAANYAGVSTNQCSLNIWNKTSAVGNLTITGGGQYGPGIALNKSTLSLTNTTITGSPGAGIDAVASSATIQSSAFLGNGTQSGGQELKAGPGSMLYVQSVPAPRTPNDIPSAYSGQAFDCWPYPADGGTSATSGQIVVEKSGVTIPSGSSSDIMASNNACATYLP